MLTSVLDNTDSSKGALCFLDNHIVFNMKNKILQNNMDAVVQLTTFNVLLSRNTAEIKIQFYFLWFCIFLANPSRFTTFLGIQIHISISC